MPELTSVATVQAYLGDTSISSSLLTTFINAAEAEIARRCNRYDDTEQGNHWLTTTRVQFIDGELSEYAMLKFTPVTAISAVAIVLGSGSTQTITLTNLTMDGREIADLAASTPGRMGKLAWRWGNCMATGAWDAGMPYTYVPALVAPSPWFGFGAGPQRLKVSYTGGFASAPADLALLATKLSAQMYRDRDRDPNVKSETLGAFSQTFVDGLATATADQMGSMEGVVALHGRPVF